MQIQIAHTDAAIAACYPVMQQLRPHITEDDFVVRVRRQERAGCRLAFVRAPDGQATAVAGFRIGENLAWGRFFYVDDLVTRGMHRSNGYGAQLLKWLKAYGVHEGCQELHLDTRIQRKEAHRFYERAGMTAVSLHFAET
jgi:GNAT superfamily N-acetyltransferase